MKTYVLFHCDEWRSYESYRLIGVASEKNLEKALKQIKKECKYTDEDLATYVSIVECKIDDLNI